MTGFFSTVVSKIPTDINEVRLSVRTYGVKKINEYISKYKQFRVKQCVYFLRTLGGVNSDLTGSAAVLLQ